jgi:mannitol/fructose-specific phosphotransferase system IIA component (Ntr-type)
MLQHLLTMEMMQLQHTVTDWQAAIRLAGHPLVRIGAVHKRYVQAMIDNVLTFGPYVALAPKIALPHARPEQGALQIGMSLLTLRESVYFDNSNNPIQLMVAFSAIDQTSHLQALAQLSNLLSDRNAVEQIIGATDKQIVLQVLQQYS